MAEACGTIVATEGRNRLANGAQIVFTDVDGTLLDGEHRPIPASAAAIAELGERGIPFVLVSARMPEALVPIQEALGFTGALVCYSGAYALDERGVELLSRPMSVEQALEARRIVAERAPEVCVMAYGYHTWAVESRSDPRVANEERIVGCESVEEGIEEAFGEVGGLHKLLLVGESDRMGALQAELARALPELTVVLSSPILCEVMAGGVSKAEGVQVVCRHYGIELAHAMAFGDGHNDVEMLRAVPESYAMANASPEVQREAAHVTCLANDENGLADELSRLLVR